MISISGPLGSPLLWKKKKRKRNKQNATLPKQGSNQIKDMPLTVTDGKDGRKRWLADSPCPVLQNLTHLSIPAVPGPGLSQTKLIITRDSRKGSTMYKGREVGKHVHRMTRLKCRVAGRHEIRLENSAEQCKNLVCQDEELKFYLMASTTTGCLEKGRAMLRFVSQTITFVLWRRPQSGENRQPRASLSSRWSLGDILRMNESCWRWEQTSQESLAPSPIRMGSPQGNYTAMAGFGQPQTKTKCHFILWNRYYLKMLWTVLWMPPPHARFLCSMATL